MAYNGGCIVGVKAFEDAYVKLSNRSGSISGVTPTTLNGESSTTQSAAWQCMDGAWTPAQNVERQQPSGTMYAIIYANAPSLSILPSWGLLFGYTTKQTAQSYNLHQYFTAASSSSGFASYNGVSVLNVQPLKLQSDRRRLLLDWPSGTGYVAEQMRRSYNGTDAGACFTEAYGAYIQELPYGQELVSYRRTRTAPTATEIKTMDGAIRRYVTGSASTSVSATWRWSDDGTIATKLTEILRCAMETLQPLIVYVPAGIYYDGPFLDLVMPTSDPTITMPAPGVYELSLEGTCQP